MQTSLPVLNTVAGQPGHLAEVLAVCFPACTPPDLNGAAPVVVAPVVPGRGVCIPKKSNLDCTGSRIVKRGSVVAFPYLVLGEVVTARVDRVRHGQFWHSGFKSLPSFTPCRDVRVVA